LTRRVLVVDDHEPWRRQIRSMLAHNRRWRVAAEAADGTEVLHQVTVERPDLILLDVELATINGIEVAKRIRQADPDSRILFMSAHRSWDIAEIALGTGARAYILKSDAGRELLPALEAVDGGSWFISGALVGRVRARTTARDVAITRSHEAAFCATHATELESLARFAEAALTDGKTVIAATTAAHRGAFDANLQARGVDVDLALRRGRYIPLDVDQLLSSIIVDGQPDEARLWQAGISLLARAAQANGGYPRVAACGEGCGKLAADGKVETAIRLEHLWDEFARACNVDMFCSYSAAALADGDAGARIAAEHSAVHSI
jgi:DNA-binding NarL/FixJ family response regulator